MGKDRAGVGRTRRLIEFSRGNAMTNIRTICVIALTAFMPAAHATAQNYPTRPIRLVVPFGAGSNSDILARTVGVRLAEVWKQQVVVDNRPGAGGNIGTDLVAKAPPDGYTI